MEPTQFIEKMVCQMREEYDKFVFESISPYCDRVTNMEISKKDLEEALLMWKSMKWIPVSERLPKGYCLFCDIDGDVYYGHIYDNKWWADGQDDRIKNVIAWMPLPEPYRAESEDAE